jgi:hypothetical protein
MRPKTSLPEGSEEITRVGEHMLVKYKLNGQPYYSIYSFYESDKGRRYFPRGGGGTDLEQVKQQLERITKAKRQ